MSDNLPDWYSTRPEHGWASRAGLARLRSLVEPLLPFVPTDEQVGLSARVMDGTHSLIIRATGSGKTMIVVIPLIARPGTLALVISPLNMLETNMVRTFASFKLPSIAINRQTLRTAQRLHRNLWIEAASPSCRALFVGPELLSSDDFDQWIRTPCVRMRLALCATDEAHVIDLWAADFRIAYQSIPTLRARLPPWVTFLGLTATCRPGIQTTAVVRGLGFQPTECVVDQGDCERHDLHIIVRPILYGISGTVFPDLDWLVPESASQQQLCDTKTLVYCNSIQLGHAVTRYLRSLLPPELAPMQYRLIRHLHSLSCDACKQDALDALCDVPGTPPCAIEVATDVVGFGVDARRVQRVTVTPRTITASRVTDPPRYGNEARFVRVTDVSR